jgi:hypothetical protein
MLVNTYRFSQAICSNALRRVQRHSDEIFKYKKSEFTHILVNLSNLKLFDNFFISSTILISEHAQVGTSFAKSIVQSFNFCFEYTALVLTTAVVVELHKNS